MVTQAPEGYAADIQAEIGKLAFSEESRDLRVRPSQTVVPDQPLTESTWNVF